MALWGKTKTGVKSVTVSNSGGNYTAAVGVEFTSVGTGGTGAAADVVLNPNGSVNSVRVTAAGSGYTAPPDVAFVGGGGATAAAYAALGAPVFADGIPTSEPTSVGKTAGEWAGNEGPAHIGWSVYSVNTASVEHITLTNRGIGYTGAPSVTVAAPDVLGVTATATATLTNGVQSVSLSTGGTGYTAAPLVVFAAGGNSDAAATSALTADEVTSITMTNYGTGYTYAPAVSFVPVGTGGSGAAGTAVLGGRLLAVNVTNPGAGYTAAPSVTIGAPVSGTGATADAIVGPKAGGKEGETIVAMNHTSIVA